jgi:hypothetical protein
MKAGNARAATSLRQVRAHYGASAEAAKCAALRAIAATRLTRWRALRDLHEDLLFIVAFPGAPATRRLALAQLRSFAARWRGVPSAELAAGEASGVVGTVTRPALAWPVAAWLAPRADIELDWPALEDPDAFEALVARLVAPAQRDAWDSGEYDTRAWIDLARGADEAPLRWLVRNTAVARDAGIGPAWDAAGVPLRWRLGDSPHAATHARLSGRRAAPVWRSGLRRPTEPPVQHVERPLTTIEPLARRDAARVVALARAALASRAREVHAINYPNLDDVTRCDLGEGVSLALIGVAPPQRLALEANYGYLLISNGVPIGYGGVSPLYRQANTGINVFDPFRGSEAAFLWLQMLRAFRTLFGVRRFVVNGYQFGAGNREAIASGAYWFYWRLGFRPADGALARLAANEWTQLARTGKRSSAALLRQLAQGDLFLDLSDFTPGDFFEEALLGPAAAAVVRRVAATGAPQIDGERVQTADVARTLRIDRAALRATTVRAALARLAPYAALLDLNAWTAQERDALAEWLLAKAAPQQADFARGATAQARFFDGLRAVAQAERDRG